MSQLQVTGEAKIRDIQGPVVANSGVITALDGAASQYVRGDGTLADFPTSSGGGSSVSYYLNSSVSQGTIGGVAYRELSKDPIIGAGTDIAISSNGYVANYITDVNDPDVTIVPGGNFNCEFYFSVNNNTGNPTTYAELYKYDGTTFTLLGSNVGVPESINQGTTIAPYYFAIPVATAALALTDRLAIRIYVNVSGRTVTLHTENGHLCQVVTTLSKGMVSLNNLTDQSQFLTTGTAGTNFAIVSSGDTHTFNLPVASATNTGKLSSTDWSTFNGKVPYTGATTDVDLGVNSYIGQNLFIKSAIENIPWVTNYLKLGYYKQSTTFSFSLGVDTGNVHSLIFTSGNSYAYTFPNTNGTIALTSDLSGYVTLATTQTISGAKTFSSSPIIDNGTSGIPLRFKQYSSTNFGLAGYTDIIPIGATLIAFAFGQTGADTKIAYFSAASLTNNVPQEYTLPNATGTLALTSQLPTYGNLTSADTSQLLVTGGTGAVIGAGTSITLLNASATNGGIVSTGTQTFAGAKTFSSSVTVGGSSTLDSLKVGTTSTHQLLIGADASYAEIQAITQGVGFNKNLILQRQGGNVGIGTSSTSFNAAGLPLVVGSGSGNTGLTIFSGASSAGSIHFADAETTGAGSYAGFINYTHSTNSMQFGTTGATPTEAMRITSGSALLVGTTSDVAGGVSVRTNISADDYSLGLITASGAAKQPLRFVNGTTAVGSVTTTTTSTSYNIVSDYRLKEDFKQIKGLELTNKIKVYDFKWKNIDARMDGVIAHELQEVIPYAVIGEKDGQNMQQVDYSKIVPILVKAIQELEARIKQLENK